IRVSLFRGSLRMIFFFSSRRRHTIFSRDWSSDVCSSDLDAGAPLARPVAGIAMGLIKENDKFAVLSDILGDEDHLGDMDFKVARSEERRVGKECRSGWSAREEKGNEQCSTV